MAERQDRITPVQRRVWRCARGVFCISLLLTLFLSVFRVESAESMALKLLERGNRRFAEGRTMHPNTAPEQRIRTATDGAEPFAAVLTCCESASSPEIIFDQGIGDLYVVRTEGLSGSAAVTANLELGFHLHGMNLAVILGHEGCMDKWSDSPEGLRSARTAILKRLQHRNGGNGEKSRVSVVEQIEATIQEILERSPMLRGAVRDGKLSLVGAVVDEKTGVVKWLGDETELGPVIALPDSVIRKDPPGSTLRGESARTVVNGIRMAARRILHSPPSGGSQKASDSGILDVRARESSLSISRMVQRVMQSGNLRFASGKLEFKEQGLERWKAIHQDGITPRATVLTVTDSQLPVEHLFNMGLGDLHVVRSAGLSLEEEQLAGVETGVILNRTPLLVVMGMKSDPVLNMITSGQFPTPSVEALLQVSPLYRVESTAHSVNSLAETAVSAAIQELLTRSPAIAEALEEGKLSIVGAVYDAVSGTVNWMDHDDPPKTESVTHHVAKVEKPELAVTPKHDHSAGREGTHQPMVESHAGAHATSPALPAESPRKTKGKMDPAAAGESEIASHEHHTGTGGSALPGSEVPGVFEVLSELEKGNKRFVRNESSSNEAWAMAALRNSGVQAHPRVSILAPSDLTLPVERIFDQAPGSFFQVRMLGSVADASAVASLEFGLQTLKTPVMVFLGHDGDRAVAAVMNQGDASAEPWLKPMAEKIRRAMERAGPSAAAIDVVRANVMQSMIDTLRSSETIRRAFHEGRVDFIGAIYHSGSGNIEWVRPGE